MRTDTEHKTGQKVSACQNVLQAALAKLPERQLSAGQVKRVAVGRQGTIHIEVEAAAGKLRFFAYAANELCELRPEGDLKIPLAAKLRGDDFVAAHGLISYRPGRRIVLGPAHGGRGTITKGYRKHRVASAVKKHEIAVAACRQSGLDVPELLSCRAENDYLVMAMQVGQPPGIENGAVDAWSLIGSGLRHFQQYGSTDGLAEFSDQDELAVLDERARRFLLVKPTLPQHWQQGREQLAAAAIDLPPAANGLAHRDLHDRQFIISGKAVSLLDVDLLCSADAALDAGNLLAHMKLRVLQNRQRSSHSAESACRQAFLINLGRQHEPDFTQRLQFYQASTCYRLALLYALRPRWVHLTDALVNEGRRCIGAFRKARGNT